MEQRSLWANEENPSSARNSLIINKQQHALSKQQQAFNRLVKKIEKLRAELSHITHSLQQKLDFYGKHIYPLEQQQIFLHKELTKCLYKFFKLKKLFSKGDKAILGEVISTQLHTIFQLEQTEPDDELKEIFKAVEKVDFDQAAGEDFDMMKQEMQFMFEKMGVDIDLDDIHPKMTEEEIMRKMNDLHSQFQQRSEGKEQKQATRKKTKKQVEKEKRQQQAEEARLKSINSIYKQLAKILHPDIEQDPDLKLQKEELMKKLTTAYKSGDLHTLLALELQWIQKEGMDIDKLTDDKLRLYNDSLKQQISDLEEEINQLLHHPRYQPLHPFVMSPAQMISISTNDIKRQKYKLIKEMKENLAALQGDQEKALAEIKAIIYTFRNQPWPDFS